MRQLVLKSNLNGIREKKSRKTLYEEKSKVTEEIKANPATYEKANVDTQPNDAEDDEIDEMTSTNNKEQSEESGFETEAFRSKMHQLMKKTNLDKFGGKESRMTTEQEKSETMREIIAMAQILEKTNFDTQPLDDDTDEIILTSEDADSSKYLGKDNVGYSMRGNDEKRINLDARESAGKLDRNVGMNGSNNPQKETSSGERLKMTPFFDPTEEEALSLECGQCGSPCDEEDMRNFGKCILCRQRDLRDPLVHKITNSESGYMFNNAMSSTRPELGYVYNNAAPSKRAKVDVKVDGEADRLVLEKQRKEQQERLFPSRAEQPIARTPLNDAIPLPPVTLQYKQVQVAPPVIPNAMKSVDKIVPPIPIPGRPAAVIRDGESQRRQSKLQPREIQDNYLQREEEAMHRQYQNVIDEEWDSGDGEESVGRLGNLEREFDELRYALDTDVFNSIVSLMSVSGI